MTNAKPYICPSAIPMAIKIGRVVTYGGENSPWNSHGFLITWSGDKSKKPISALPQYLWLSNVVEWSVNVRRPHIPSQVAFWSCGHVTNLKPYISTFAISVANKLRRAVFCGEWNQPSKSCELLITWSRDKWKKLYLHFCNT